MNDAPDTKADLLAQRARLVQRLAEQEAVATDLPWRSPERRRATHEKRQTEWELRAVNAALSQVNHDHLTAGRAHRQAQATQLDWIEWKLDRVLAHLGIDARQLLVEDEAPPAKADAMDKRLPGSFETGKRR